MDNRPPPQLKGVTEDEKMSKIELSDTVMEIIVKMSDGNPGAVNAIMDVMTHSDRIDPQAIERGLGSILFLDTLEIYGTDIYILWSDKCNKNTRKFIMLLRSVQLGYFAHDRIKAMASDQMRQVDLTAEEWDEIDCKVCLQLNDFEKRTSAEETS